MSEFLPKKVNVQLAINQEEVKRNIQTNLAQIPSWFGSLFYPNGYEAIIISAGPSLEKYVTELNLVERMQHPNRSFVVFCVKHALPRLLALGVEPDFCVILDGREFDDESTHGINRKTLFEKIPEKTIFWIASMSHPGYAKYLLSRGARVLGWHTAVDGLKDFPIREPVISGGTSSGMRCIGIANALGIRDITLVGFDSCILDPTPEKLKEKDKKGRPKYIPVDLPVLRPSADPDQRTMIDTLEKTYKDNGFVYVASLAKRFYTTGELLAQSQDFEQIFSNSSYDIKFTVLDDGIANHMFNNMSNVAKRGFSFVEYLKKLCPRKEPSTAKEYTIEPNEAIVVNSMSNSKESGGDGKEEKTVQ